MASLYPNTQALTSAHAFNPSLSIMADIPSFPVVEHEVTGNLHVTQHTQYNRVKADHVLVNEKVTARIYGTVKDVVLKPGSTLLMHGTVSGKIVNEGGELRLFK